MHGHGVPLVRESGCSSIFAGMIVMMARNRHASRAAPPNRDILTNVQEEPRRSGRVMSLGHEFPRCAGVDANGTRYGARD